MTGRDTFSGKPGVWTQELSLTSLKRPPSLSGSVLTALRFLYSSAQAGWIDIHFSPSSSFYRGKRRCREAEKPGPGWLRDGTGQGAGHTDLKAHCCTRMAHRFSHLDGVQAPCQCWQFLGSHASVSRLMGNICRKDHLNPSPLWYSHE